MASNQDLIDLKLGAWEWFIGSTNLGSLADEDVTIELDANIIKATSNFAGKSTVKAWTGGTNAKVTLTLNHKHKDKIRLVFSHLLKNRVGQNSNAGNGNAGSFDVSGMVGDCLQPFVLTGYLNHTLCENGTRFANNNANPISIQMNRTITPEALKWVFSTSDVATQEVVFEGMADLDNVNNSVATIGFVSLPSAILSGLAFTNLGAGYSSAPTVVFGINFVGSSAVTIGQYINTANRLYKVTIAGTMSATAPTHTSGTLANGTATLEYIGVLPVATVTVANGQVQQNSVSISTFGSNVPSDLPVSFTGGGFSTVATATVVTY
jgi:hypothetical protein